MIYSLMIFAFVLGYVGIAFEHPLKIDFIWYVKNITLYALIGYISGILTFLVINQI